MKKPTAIAICSIGLAFFVTFVGMMAGVDPVIALAIGVTFGVGLYGRWLRDEARMKSLKENLQRGEW